MNKDLKQITPLVNKVRHSQKVQRLVYQLPPNQLEELMADLLFVGLAHEAGGDTYAVIRKLGQKYRLGRRRKLYEALAAIKDLDKFTANLLAGYQSTAHQPVVDA